MHLFVFKRLGLEEAKPKKVTLQLADCSIKYLEGKVKDFLIKVGKFVFPEDFIILDYEADLEVPIILERPFLEAGQTLIDVKRES